ncbi:MAG: class I SAM-dependent methyltransferase, partial [Dokdonella sp.]
MTFKDHFSGHAAVYQAARPDYPAALHEFLVGEAPSRQRAWDAGCGNGQASVALAEYFDTVVATDPSAEQIANASLRDNISYRVEPAEQSSLESGSVDLVCVAQALHWFDLARFHEEVRRVLKPRGVVAFWTYADCRVEAGIDVQKDRLYLDLTAAYWPPERALVESGYASLAFPFERIPTPIFEMRMQ